MLADEQSRDLNKRDIIFESRFNFRVKTSKGTSRLDFGLSVDDDISSINFS